jgi:hypothetical protein
MVGACPLMGNFKKVHQALQRALAASPYHLVFSKDPAGEADFSISKIFSATLRSLNHTDHQSGIHHSSPYRGKK